MGLLSSLLTFPVSGPVAGIQWSLRQVQRIVDEQLTDDTPIKQELMELQLALESGDITDDVYLAREGELMARLREVRAWRERLGRDAPGGPVRFAAPAAEIAIIGDETSAPGAPTPPAEALPDAPARPAGDRE